MFDIIKWYVISRSVQRLKWYFFVLFHLTHHSGSSNHVIDNTLPCGRLFVSHSSLALWQISLHWQEIRLIDQCIFFPDWAIPTQLTCCLFVFMVAFYIVSKMWTWTIYVESFIFIGGAYKSCSRNFQITTVVARKVTKNRWSSLLLTRQK